MNSLLHRGSSLLLLPSSLSSLKRTINGRAFPHLAKCFSTSSSSPLIPPSTIRNVAIVAHVDHGKTTLVNELLQQTNPLMDTSSASMDNLELEQERGITIASKITRLQLPSNQVINMVDTPGHVDFSGEVDRMLSIVDGVCLVIDAKEGILAQTKYVLERAIRDHDKRVILVLNKCDVKDAWDKVESGIVESEVFDLMDLLGATEDQMDFLTVYASGKAGWCTTDLELVRNKFITNTAGPEDFTVQPLIDAIIQHIPKPKIIEDEERLTMAVATVGTDPYLGRTCTGRIYSGSLEINDNLLLVPRENNDIDTTPSETSLKSNLSGLFVHQGVSRHALDPAIAFPGDIVTLTTIPSATKVGDTLTNATNPYHEPLPTPAIPPPILSMEISVNNSPLMGQEGKSVTFNSIWDRLVREIDNNISMNIAKKPDEQDKGIVYCRGTMQLGVLLEVMRREGFEVTLSPPKVIQRTAEDGTKLEPFEELHVTVEELYVNKIMDTMISGREGTMINHIIMEDGIGAHKLVFELPSRELLGLSMEFASITKGTALVHHLYLEDREVSKKTKNRERKGKLVSNASGKATLYTLSSISDRGHLFISVGDIVYPGMIIGERTDQQKHVDLEVNPCKTKQATNVRSVNKDEKLFCPPPKVMTVEEMIGYIDADEVMEVTPMNIRLRKKELDPNLRARMAREDKKRRDSRRSA